jgi:hypothetical protein
VDKRRSDADASKGRDIAFAVLSLLFGWASLGGLFGIAIVIGWFDNELAGMHRVHNISFGVTYGVLTATAFFALVSRRGRRTSIFSQIGAVAVAVLVASLLSANFGYAVIGVILIVALVVLVAVLPGHLHTLARDVNISPVLGAFVLVSAVPLVWAALTWARYQRDGSPLDPHVAQSHWTTMASMAFALLLVSALASARPSGWRFTAWCAGAGLIAYGIASIVFADFAGTSSPYPGSEGVGWGVASVLGGAGFIVLAEWQARQPASTPPTSATSETL